MSDEEFDQPFPSYESMVAAIREAPEGAVPDPSSLTDGYDGPWPG